MARKIHLLIDVRTDGGLHMSPACRTRGPTVFTTVEQNVTCELCTDFLRPYRQPKQRPLFPKERRKL